MSHVQATEPHAASISPAVLDIQGVARLLQISSGTFQNKRRQLERAGFPRPLPILKCRWSRAAVIAWINDEAVEPSSSSEFDALQANSDMVKEALDRLNARYNAGAS